MIKTLIHLAIGIVFLTGCTKEIKAPSEQQILEPVSSNSVNAIPIKQSATFSLETFVLNHCNGEYVYINGTVNYKVSGMVSDNKITYVLHYNYAGVTGVGLNSGNKYIANGAFNYSNSNNFSEQFVYQQNASFNFISVAEGDSFKIINDWHLTVNANGTATFFFTTDGDVLVCN